jgi:type II secretory pathway pseudopilin PulG
MKGFTLIETIIYLAIVGGLFVAIVSFALFTSESRNKSYVAQEVQANARVALDEITELVRTASAINTSTSLFGTDPGYLSLTMTSTTLNPTTIGLNKDDGQIQVKQGSGASSTLVSDEIRVTNLVFADLTASSTREHVHISLTVDYDATSSTEFSFSRSFRTAASVRY